MESLKKLRQRIESVRTTQKMTRAMRLVATTRLRRTQAAIEAARPYTKRMDSLMRQIFLRMPAAADQLPLMSGTGRDTTHLFVVFTTDRGLCGGLNAAVVRSVKERITRLERHDRRALLLCVGRKGYKLLERDYRRCIVGMVELKSKSTSALSFEHAEPIAERILDLFQRGEFDVCCQCYARFRSILHQPAKAQQLIPVRYAVVSSADQAEAERARGGAAVTTYEPGEREVLSRLLTHHVAAQVYRALLESAASEEGARMAATDRATRNAGELIGKLTLIYNRERQARITREIIEIVAGMEAQRRA